MSKSRSIAHRAAFLQTFHTAKTEAQRVTSRSEYEQTCLECGMAPCECQQAEAKAMSFVKAQPAHVRGRLITVRGHQVRLGDGFISEAQAKWIIDIATTRVLPSGATAESVLVRLEQGFAKHSGTQFISAYKNLPKKQAEVAPTPIPAELKAVTQDGIYVDRATGRVFKVQFNKAQGTGSRLYAKQLMVSFERDGEWEEHTDGLLNLDLTGVACTRAPGKPDLDNSWEYVRGLVHQIKPEWRLTPESAIEWGVLYGSCIRCHRDLTKESSIRQMMGDTCARKQGF